jgi:hypothetical protein
MFHRPADLRAASASLVAVLFLLMLACGCSSDPQEAAVETGQRRHGILVDLARDPPEPVRLTADYNARDPFRPPFDVPASWPGTDRAVRLSAALDASGLFTGSWGDAPIVWGFVLDPADPARLMVRDASAWGLRHSDPEQPVARIAVRMPGMGWRDGLLVWSGVDGGPPLHIAPVPPVR